MPRSHCPIHGYVSCASDAMLCPECGRRTCDCGDCSVRSQVLDAVAPAGFIKEIIRVPRQSNPKPIFAVEAFVNGPMAIHRNVGGDGDWSLSHRGTGLSLVLNAPLKDLAAIAAALADITDWSQIQWDGKTLRGWTDDIKRLIAPHLFAVRPELKAKYQRAEGDA